MKLTQEDRRGFGRKGFREPIQLIFKDPELSRGCLSFDLSESGVRIELNKFVPLGTEVSLQLSLENNNKVDCVGEIVWIVKIPFSDRYQAGLEFSKEDAIFDSRNRIFKFLQTNQD